VSAGSQNAGNRMADRNGRRLTGSRCTQAWTPRNPAGRQRFRWRVRDGFPAPPGRRGRGGVLRARCHASVVLVEPPGCGPGPAHGLRSSGRRDPVRGLPCRRLCDRAPRHPPPSRRRSDRRRPRPGRRSRAARPNRPRPRTAKMRRCSRLYAAPPPITKAARTTTGSRPLGARCAPRSASPSRRHPGCCELRTSPPAGPPSVWPHSRRDQGPQYRYPAPLLRHEPRIKPCMDPVIPARHVPNADLPCTSRRPGPWPCGRHRGRRHQAEGGIFSR